MTTYGYARVSTHGQSLDVQLSQLAGVDQIFQEKISGAKRDRPELDKLLKTVKAGDSVVVCKMDRLARSTKDLLEISEYLEKQKVSLKILNMNLDTSTPTGKLMLTILGSIAEFERSLMLERQAEGIARAKKEGKYKGREATARAKTREVLDLKAQGLSWGNIVAKTGISRASVYRILQTA